MRINRRGSRHEVLFLTLGLAVFSAAAQNGPSLAIHLQRNVAVAMRDGTVLRADVYAPLAPGRFPVLLERTPYNKDEEAEAAIRAAEHGYIVVIEDVRGRYESAGEWYPFAHESSDGFDTVEWAAALPGADGRVGMFGSSYVGATQLLAAISKPPHLAGICPSDTASDYHDGWIYEGGAFQQWFSESWTTLLAQNSASRRVKDASTALELKDVLPLNRYPLFSMQKMANHDALTRELAPYFLDWLEHPDNDEYWQRWSIRAHYSDIQVPALTITAWYDIFQGGALQNYLGLRANAGSENARSRQRLIIGIGGHAGAGEKVGDVDFGPGAGLDDDDMARVLDWYDFLFHGAQNEFAAEKPVHFFLMGINRWRDADNWPPSGAISVKFYLRSKGQANSANGNGQLSREMPETEAADTYIYDPANPVPTTGGPLCCIADQLKPGPRDQRGVEARADVLVYSTPPLDRDLEVTGPVSVDVFAISSNVDTDFTAKLVDVAPDGTAINLSDGIIRARYRQSESRPSPIDPGRCYRYHIDLSSTANVFLKGHRVRLEISSSNFPRFDRNPNTGSSSASSSQFTVAHNRILHDGQHPSALNLTVIPNPNQD
jgi:uncharacterized protein